MKGELVEGTSMATQCANCSDSIGFCDVLIWRTSDVSQLDKTYKNENGAMLSSTVRQLKNKHTLCDECVELGCDDIVLSLEQCK